MRMGNGKLQILALIILLSSNTPCRSQLGSDHHQYTVGDSVWSIPPTNNFFANWSSSYTFHIGDTLYFDFNSGMYNVIQVTRGEYESCTAEQALKAWIEGLAVVHLTQKGVFYFICNVSNYCALGLKVSVIVNQKESSSTISSPSPSPVAA